MAQEPDFHATTDYECYIHLYNRTSVDFGLLDSNAILGTWAKGSPPNTVEAGSEAVIQLNDNRGFSGSQGEVTYELYHPKQPKTPLTFKLEFCDPYGRWNDNYLKARSNNPRLVSCHVLNYHPTGHPFTAHVEIHLADSAAMTGMDTDLQPVEDVELPADVPSALANGKLRAAYEIGFDGGFGLVHKNPIHEDMAICAFIASDLHFPKGTIYNNLDRKQWEFIRGLVWSDDPSCLLFKNSAESNSEFELGDKFGFDFMWGSPNCMTQRSHFGNLQFLHSMASGHGEDPAITKGRALAWLEVMYKLAIGQINENGRLDESFPKDFHASSEPRGSSSLRDLLLGNTTAYRRADISRRALGSCLHLIQDSYAVGHTLRRLRNPEDLDRRDDEAFVRFKPGKYAQLGPIITFHTYAGQSKRHGHYDESSEARDPRRSETFNHIIGARDAIDQCTELMNFYASNTKWEDGVASFLADKVLALDKHPTLSNADVDERFALPDTSGAESLVSSVCDSADEEWQAGLERKLALLEGGLAQSDRTSEAVPSTLQRVTRALGPVLKCILAIFAIALVSFLTQVVARAFLY